MEKHRTPGVAPVPAGTPTENLEGRSFIGGRAREFAPGLSPRQPKEDQGPEEKTEETSEKELLTCPACEEALHEADIYCRKCGIELGRKDVIKALGIEFTEEDISSYLFKGYLVKEIEIIKGKMATFKTLTAEEGQKVEEEVMAHFREKDATNNQWANIHAILHLSYGWYKFDDVPIVEDAAKRKDHILKAMGVHLVDMAAKKYNLFNRAVAAMLEDPEVLKN